MQSGSSKALKLRIELVPRPLHRYNLRSEAVGLGDTGWRKLRRTIIAENGPACQVCGSTERPHAHEIWQYEEKARSGIAHLIGVGMVCARCHAIHHWGSTKLLMSEGKLQGAAHDTLIAHFMKVNQCSEDDFARHEKHCVEEWERRNQLKWRIDWGELAKSIKQVRKKSRVTPISPVELKVPCANCRKPITVSVPPQHSRTRKRFGIVYACDSCGRGGRMEFPPGMMNVVITKGGRALFSADVESPEWEAEKGARYFISE